MRPTYDDETIHDVTVQFQLYETGHCSVARE